jgi:AcrR family transcriptional regulator
VTPRRYTLGRRAESAAATREAILDAAIALYREVGLPRATLKAIAARADVSRGTILHHFGDADGLLDATLVRIMAELEIPNERILDGLSDPEARLRAFLHAMVAFFRRSAPWWQVFEAEMSRPATQAREAEYYAALGRLQAAALGPELAADPTVQAVVGAVIHPGTLGSVLWALESAGMSADDASRVIEDLVVGYVRGHAGAQPASEQAPDPGRM